MKRERYQNGVVYLDKRVDLWYFQWYDEGRRKQRPIGPISKYSNKTKATKAAVAAGFRDEINLKAKLERQQRSFEAVARLYMQDRMPTRHGGCRNWLDKYAIPQWGDLPLDEIGPGKVELWLKGLERAPKSKAHIRAAMRLVYEYAMANGTTLSAATRWNWLG